MTTKTYDYVLASIEALAGNTLAAEEQARLGYFINRRARKAYDESEYWPRWLVTGEERGVSSSGLMPYAEGSLSTIGTVLRIHATEPFRGTRANEYAQFHAYEGGVQITGYEPATYSVTDAFLISGVLVPDATGVVLRTRLPGSH